VCGVVWCPAAVVLAYRPAKGQTLVPPPADVPSRAGPFTRVWALERLGSTKALCTLMRLSVKVMTDGPYESGHYPRSQGEHWHELAKA